jgi:hypothetical protein
MIEQILQAFSEPVAMSLRRRSRWLGAVLVIAGVAPASAFPSRQAQPPPQNERPAERQDKHDKQEKPDQAQQIEFKALVKLVDAAADGSHPAMNDFSIRWQHDAIKAQEGKTYIPFTITLDPKAFTANTALLYVRVVERQPPTEPTGTSAAGAPRVYPFEDIHVIELKPSAVGQLRISRAFAVRPGEYDVYLALRERPGAVPAGAARPAPKASVLRQGITAPDFWTNELTTSSIILADSVEPLTAPPTRQEQVENPYTLGTTRIVAAADNTFTKKEELSFLFLVYNTGMDGEGKPDIEVEYKFFQKTGETEKYFNLLEPQKFNAKTQAPEFDLRNGQQIVCGMAVPLASFPDGDFRLEITVNDKIANKVLKRDVNFSVVGP